MRRQLRPPPVVLPLVVCLLAALLVTGPAGAGGPPPSHLAAAAAATGDSEPAEPVAEEAERREETPGDTGFLPRLDVFFPEGDLDLRASRLANKVYFEGQVKYNFIDGDITAFLRYRYYGLKQTFQITGFDSIEFDSLEEFSDEFERVRGFLVLTQWPHDYHHRTSLLFELDRIISNKDELRFDNNRTNTYLRLGYQIGTPDDPRSNAIVGERRAVVDRLFTPFRRIGPGDNGLSAAVTWGFDFGPGDFDYVKVEAEGLKRFEVGKGRFLVGRVRAGTFPYERLAPGAEERPEPDRYTIPRAELFRLDGRTNLKGVSERTRGTEQLYTTWEMFFPWFVDDHRRFLRLDWQNWYWVLYGGLGATGFETDVFTDSEAYYPDLGIGFESSFRYKRYTFFLSGVVAHAFRGDGDVEAQLSIKSYR
jgi:hypothetical protein